MAEQMACVQVEMLDGEVEQGMVVSSAALTVGY